MFTVALSLARAVGDSLISAYIELILVDDITTPSMREKVDLVEGLHRYFNLKPFNDLRPPSLPVHSDLRNVLRKIQKHRRVDSAMEYQTFVQIFADTDNTNNAPPMITETNKLVFFASDDGDGVYPRYLFGERKDKNNTLYYSRNLQRDSPQDLRPVVLGFEREVAGRRVGRMSDEKLEHLLENISSGRIGNDFHYRVRDILDSIVILLKNQRDELTRAEIEDIAGKHLKRSNIIEQVVQEVERI